jgi:hypothetical protein
MKEFWDKVELKGISTTDILNMLQKNGYELFISESRAERDYQYFKNFGKNNREAIEKTSIEIDFICG